MLRGSFNEGAFQDETRMIEAVLVDFTGPHTRMDWPFYFCTLRLDSGEHIRASIKDWSNGLQEGQRVRGKMLVRGIFTDHSHFDVLERANPTAPPSLLNRLRGVIERTFGR